MDTADHMHTDRHVYTYFLIRGGSSVWGLKLIKLDKGQRGVNRDREWVFKQKKF